MFVDPNRPDSGEGHGSKRSKEMYSIFPVENEELLYNKWEDHIILDAWVGKGFVTVSSLIMEMMLVTSDMVLNWIG